MAKNKQKSPADFIVPLNINGLQGRMLRMPAPKDKKREILFVYGHHASLERCWGIMEDLNQYGAVTMPDLPGFGGMDSFHRIGLEPTLDNFADYLASFVKLRYRRRRVTIMGFSLGFVIITRMLQRYPDLANKVDLLISAVGFAHKDDLSFTTRGALLSRHGAYFFSLRLPAIFFRNVLLSPTVLRLAYGKTRGGREKLGGLSKAEYRAIMNFEIDLWHANDVRTHMATLAAVFTLDNCQQQVKLPVWHVSVDKDRYFDNHRVEQHMRIIFNDFHGVRSQMNTHGPSIILNKTAAEPFIPPQIRQLLSQDA